MGNFYVKLQREKDYRYKLGCYSFARRIQSVSRFLFSVSGFVESEQDGRVLPVADFVLLESIRRILNIL